VFVGPFAYCFDIAILDHHDMDLADIMEAIQLGRYSVTWPAPGLHEDQEHLVAGEVAQGYLAARNRGQGESGRFLARLQATAAQSAWSGRFQLIQPPTQKAQGAQRAQQQKSQAKD
jgi:hypothetical protein